MANANLIQMKGSSAKVVMDLEATYKALKPAGSSRRPVNIPFTSFSLARTRPQNQSNIIRGNRNSARPFRGNIDVSGSGGFPLDFVNSGFLFALAVGTPTSREALWTDSVLSGAPTLTISGGAGVFSAGQASMSVGDRVIYRNAAGTQLHAFITAVDPSDNTAATLKKELDGATNADDVTAATVLAIVPNQITGTAGTVTIASGVATFSEDHSAELAVGSLVVYNATSLMEITEVVTAGSVYRVRAGAGFWPADAAGVDVESIETLPYWEHVYKIHPTNSLPSAVFSKTLTDGASPLTQHYVGTKANSLSMTFDAVNPGELLMDIELQGANEQSGYTSYEAGSSTAPAANGANTGNGSVEFAGAKVGAPSETWTLTATGATSFTVVGSVSGSQGVATVGTPYKNDYVHFTIEAGTVAFQSGDIFTFVVTGQDEGAVDLERGIFDLFDVTVKEGSTLVTNGVIRNLSLTIGNNLDPDSFVLGGGGERVDLPEGIAGVSGNMEYVFRKADIQEKAAAGEDSGIELTLQDQSSQNKIVIRMSELNFGENSPSIEGPAGITQQLDFEAFYEDNSDASAIYIVLQNQHPSYALN